jgi:hypothetical protein
MHLGQDTAAGDRIKLIAQGFHNFRDLWRLRAAKNSLLQMISFRGIALNSFITGQL